MIYLIVDDDIILPKANKDDQEEDVTFEVPHPNLLDWMITKIGKQFTSTT